jgi:hypothetical protein
MAGKTGSPKSGRAKRSLAQRQNTARLNARFSKHIVSQSSPETGSNHADLFVDARRKPKTHRKDLSTIAYQLKNTIRREDYGKAKIARLEANNEAVSALGVEQQHELQQLRLNNLDLQLGIDKNQTRIVELERSEWAQSELARDLVVQLQVLRAQTAEKLVALQAANAFHTAEIQAQYQQELERAREKSLQDHLELQAQLDEERKVNTALSATSQKRKRKVDALEKKVKRRKVAIEQEEMRELEEATARSKEVFMKEKRNGNRVKPAVRDLIRWMASRGVTTPVMDELLHKVLKTWNLELQDNISERTISRIILEGLIIAKLQIGYELSLTPRE